MTRLQKNLHRYSRILNVFITIGLYAAIFGCSSNPLKVNKKTLARYEKIQPYKTDLELAAALSLFHQSKGYWSQNPGEYAAFLNPGNQVKSTGVGFLAHYEIIDDRVLLVTYELPPPVNKKFRHHAFKLVPVPDKKNAYLFSPMEPVLEPLVMEPYEIEWKDGQAFYLRTTEVSAQENPELKPAIPSP